MLDQVFCLKYGKPLGKGPASRYLLNHFTADDHYEALVASLMPVERWVDVGCGRAIFPSNPRLTRHLRSQVREIIGIDPDPNVRDNPFIDQGIEAPVEDAQITDCDLVTMRMVAEHIERPREAMAAVRKMLKPGGRVVIYTPWKWSPISWVARLTPMSIHHAVKGFIWDTEERDTFPVQYKMNTRRSLQFDGFDLESYQTVTDCSATAGCWWLNVFEILVAKCLGRFYPERCILAVLRRSPEKR